MDWDKAKRGKPEFEPEPIRAPSDREARFLRARQADLKRDAAARRGRVWSLLGGRKRVIASVQVDSADAARKLFRARGITRAWLRRIR
jgi:hypothetical protein